MDDTRTDSSRGKGDKRGYSHSYISNQQKQNVYAKSQFMLVTFGGIFCEPVDKILKIRNHTTPKG